VRPTTLPVVVAVDHFRVTAVAGVHRVGEERVGD